MDKLARDFRAKNGGNDVDEFGIGFDSDTLLVIRLPDSRALRIVSRSLFLALILLTLPSIGSVIRSSSNSPDLDLDLDSDSNSDSSKEFKILPILLRNLVDEGLIKKGHKGFVLGSAIDDLEFLKESGIDLVIGDELWQEKVDAHHVFDFMFTANFHGIHLIDGVLKHGGLVISSLGYNPSDELRLLRNFKIVYLRRFENTVIAMRKTVSSSSSSSINTESCGKKEKKKAALKRLEGVYLEPARVKRSTFTSRKIKDSLDEYPRRVFISDDSSSLDWFYKNYPMRDQEFEVIGMEGDGQETEVLTKNVRREDYVVMKAEAQVVEEMLKAKTLSLVDELFLECKNGEDDVRKRAYLQCLELYGKVKDEGVVVHQWWF